MEYCSWMYNRNYPNRRFLREEFIEGVNEFITHAMSLEPFQIGGLIRCPCVKCKCLHFFRSEDVKTHLYKKGFMDNYFVWTYHGEIDGIDGVFHNVVGGESSRSVGNNVQHPRYHEMVADALGMHFDFETHKSVEQPPNEETKYFYERLDAASHPLKQGSMHSKCAWEDRYNRKICANREYKCRKRLSDSFSSARKVKKKLSWVLPDLWEDMQRYWRTDKFGKHNELEKKARASKKGGSLHCLGSRSIGDTRKHLEKKYGRKMSHDEFFMETHIRKKKALADPTRWVEDWAETTHGRYKINLEEYTQSLPRNEQGERPLISEEEKKIWLSAVGGPKKGLACSLLEKSFRRYRARLQGIGTSAQDKAIYSLAISSMEEKITKLTAEVEEIKAREKKNFDTLQGQLKGGTNNLISFKVSWPIFLLMVLSPFPGLLLLPHLPAM